MRPMCITRPIRLVRMRAVLAAWLTIVLGSAPLAWADEAAVAAAQALGKARPVLTAQPDGNLVCEAEEFQVQSPGWEAKPWGSNYYAATFANTLLSRKAYLGAPADGPRTTASLNIQVPERGRYLVLARYEAAYRFQTQFRIQVAQNGKVLFDRLYGARDNLKIWAFGQKLKSEVAWSWGAVENIVWEGHDAAVDLEAGKATVTLVADKQPKPAAKRNVDLVMLTRDAEQVQMRIDKEGYLPLDGMLTQSGDVWLRVHNQGGEKIAVAAPPCQEHSPYWVHIRNWKPMSIAVEPGQTTEWIDVGGLLDALNDGQWSLTVAPPTNCRIELGVRTASGSIEVIKEVAGKLGTVPLAYHADTRYSHLLRSREEVLLDLLAYLKKIPVHGKTPQRTLIYASTFAPGLSPQYDAAAADLRRMYGLSDPVPTTPSAGGIPRGYIDVRSVPTDKLADHCTQLGAGAKQIAVVSLGDEIGLPQPAGQAANDAFRAWLMKQGVKPADVDPAAGGDWSKIEYSPAANLKESKPGLYYWSRRYLHHYGIQAIKARTDILRPRLPAAQIGANFSPHHGGAAHAYLGEVFQWIQCFRDDGLTLPWSEDYIWQVPVGSPQMNEINLDMARAGLRGKPNRKILYYVMPHWPGNTPNMWRRLFYGALGHGMKIVNLFEFEPVQVAYTENHVTNDAMFGMVLVSFRELGTFEDFVQDGQVRPAQAALWFSETGDIWGDTDGSMAAAKRGLYTAIRHQQIPLDFVIDDDAQSGALAAYKVLYLTDAHVSAASSQKIAQWVAAGGTLLATAGAGMFDELNRPNKTLRELLGVEQIALDAPADAQVSYIKQDLPFAKPLATATWKTDDGERQLPALGARSRIQLAGATAVAAFSDGSPAVVERSVDKGRAIYCALLPSLAYYQPAIPLRPVDRGSTDDAMSHLLPSDFDPAAAALVALPAAGLMRPVVASEPLVETTLIDSKHGVLVPLVNWNATPQQGLTLTFNAPVPSGSAALASGKPVEVVKQDGKLTVKLDLEIADALMLRP